MTSIKKIINMNKKRTNITFKDRYLGIIVLITVQFIVGLIHIIFGLIMLLGNFSVTTFPTTSTIYSSYTFIYGTLTFVFAYLLLTNKQSGWIGTILVSLFVIMADTLTALNMLIILGIPKIAAIGEIPYGILIIGYLAQNHVRSKYNNQF